MSKLEQLPQITEQLLDGLRADDVLKHRIYQKAAQNDDNRSFRLSRRGAIIALSGLSAVMVAVFVLLGHLPSSGNPEAGHSSDSSITANAVETVEIETVTAGEHRTDSPILLQEVIDETIRQYEEEETEEEPESTITPEPSNHNGI